MLLRVLGYLSFLLLTVSLSAQSNKAAESPSVSSPAAAAAPAAESQASATAPPSDSAELEIIKRKSAEYPIAAQRNGIQGQVWIQVLVSEKGDVEKAEVISGDPMLTKSALDAAKKFKFKPYIKNGKAIKVATKLPFNFTFAEKIVEKGFSADGSVIEATRLKTGADRAGDSATSNNVPPQRVRVSQGVSEGMLVHAVAPVYPERARADRVQGRVILQAVIGRDGLIHDLKVVSGPTELAKAAIGAVQQWRYRPYVLKGEPVEVETEIQVNFALRR
jgi:TonB family protein